METDKIKLIFVYSIAAIIIIGGGAMLFAMRNDPPGSQSATLSLAIVAIIGTAVAFLFNSESATRATRASERATAAAQVPPVEAAPQDGAA